MGFTTRVQAEYTYGVTYMYVTEPTYPTLVDVLNACFALVGRSDRVSDAIGLH